MGVNGNFLPRSPLIALLLRCFVLLMKSVTGHDYNMAVLVFTLNQDQEQNETHFSFEKFKFQSKLNDCQFLGHL